MIMSCSYKNCENVHRSFSSKTFFNLPNDSRREVWIKNSGNETLHEIDASKRRLFCEDHFDPKYFRTQFNRTILRRDAIPYPYEESQDLQEVEFIEMECSEDENDDKIEETESESSQSINDQNDVIILLNNKQNRQIAPNNTIQIPVACASNVLDSKSIRFTKQVKSERSPSINDSNDVEVNFIVVDEHKTDKTIEPNENGQTPSKRLRLEIEPMPNQADKSSQNEVKIPPPKRPNDEPSKTIEELVSSSEAFDTNNEDKYFILSILGTMKRLTPHKRALARCHILSYLTGIEYGDSNSTT